MRNENEVRARLDSWEFVLKCRECGKWFDDMKSFLDHIKNECPYVWIKLDESQHVGLIFPKKLGGGGGG